MRKRQFVSIGGREREGKQKRNPFERIKLTTGKVDVGGQKWASGSCQDPHPGHWRGSGHEMWCRMDVEAKAPVLWLSWGLSITTRVLTTHVPFTYSLWVYRFYFKKRKKIKQLKCVKSRKDLPDIRKRYMQITHEEKQDEKASGCESRVPRPADTCRNILMWKIV